MRRAGAALPLGWSHKARESSLLIGREGEGTPVRALDWFRWCTCILLTFLLPCPPLLVSDSEAPAGKLSFGSASGRGAHTGRHLNIGPSDKNMLLKRIGSQLSPPPKCALLHSVTPFQFILFPSCSTPPFFMHSFFPSLQYLKRSAGFEPEL